MLRLTILAPVGAVLGLVLAAPAVAMPVAGAESQRVSQAEPADEVVLPSRVANAVRRNENTLYAAEQAIDAGDSVKAGTLLRTLRLGVYRADRAARAQMNAAPPADEARAAQDEAPVSTGPDSVVAVLALEQTVVTTLTGLFDTKRGTTVDNVTRALFTTMNARGKLLDAVIALDPEGAGADYADGMADTVAGYDDEVANISEALAGDQLSAGGKKVLTAALAQSKATQTKVSTAFGGGE
jgi:hypothetical protein